MGNLMFLLVKLNYKLTFKIVIKLFLNYLVKIQL